MNPLGWTSIGLGVLLALSLAFGFYERSEYESEKAGRVADTLAAQQAASKKIEAAKAESDASIAALQTRIAALSVTTTTYVDRIVKVPVTMACAQSPAMKDASEAVRALVTGK